MKPARPAKTHPSAPLAPGEVRLIGGQWKRSRLTVADVPGLRPTPNRVRETLFNWLGQDLRGWRCVDAFAGTGALGFEAASRGAAHVLLCEQHPAALAAMHKLCERLAAQTVEVRRADGLSALSQLPASSVDLVFLDPPFDSDLAPQALQTAARAVKPGAWVYLESAQAWTAEGLAPLGLELQRHLKAGAVHAHLLRRGGIIRAWPNPSSPSTLAHSTP